MTARLDTGRGFCVLRGLPFDRHGQAAADALYLGFVQAYAIHVARLDPDMFSDPAASLAEVLDAYQDETDEEFPQDPALQLAEVLRSMARAWDGPTARLLRQAKGAPADAALGLVTGLHYSAALPTEHQARRRGDYYRAAA